MKKTFDYLEKLKPEIDKIIEKYLPKKATKKWLEFVFGKPHYVYNLKAAQRALIEPCWEFLNRGGKRWRPVLFLLITEALKGNTEKIKDFIIIPELIHNGTLIIDDIQDNSELRRGKPCLHKIFGIDIALNAGNFLYFLPLLVLIKNQKRFEPEILNKTYQTYIQEMLNLSFGQGTDVFWAKEKIKKIEEKEYLQMCAFKTGCLSRMAAKMAAILSKGNEKLVEKLGQIAEAIGVAFQIQDDILDITLDGKDREKFGKVFAQDIKDGKRTLIAIQALKKANPKDKKRLLEILNSRTDNLSEIKEAVGLIKKYGGLNYAKNLSQKIVSDAWQEVDKLLPESKAKKKLKDFINYLVERKI